MHFDLSDFGEPHPTVDVHGLSVGLADHNLDLIDSTSRETPKETVAEVETQTSPSQIGRHRHRQKLSFYAIITPLISQGFPRPPQIAGKDDRGKEPGYS